MLPGKKGGEFYTPESLSTLLVKILDPIPDKKILDPACGTGSLLIKTYEYIASKESTGNLPVYLFGQDVNFRSVAIAKMNALLHSMTNACIEVGDSLLENKFKDEAGDKFDFILTNPPIGLKHDKSTLWRLESDSPINFIYGSPTRVSDANFVQLVLDRLADDGRAALLIGLRLLVVSNQEASIRKNIIEADLIESIITLPTNILPHTTAPSAIIVLNKKKSEELKEKILFIYADKEFKDTDRTQRIIEQENQNKIINAYFSRKDQKHFSAVASIEKIRENNYSLLSADYVGINKINLSFGSDTQWVEISTLAQVIKGTVPGKLPEGETPVLRGGNLRKFNLTVDDLDKRDISEVSSKIIYSQTGDILTQRIGGKPAFLLITESLAGIPIVDTVFIIRFYQVDLVFARYLVEFLNSESGLAHLSNSFGGALIKGLRITDLRRIKIPVPSQSVTELVENLCQLENSLHAHLQKVKQLKHKLFSAEDEAKFDLRGWSIEAQVLSESVIQADDFSFQMRNAFPHVLAYPHRNLNAIQNEADIYREQLRIAENLLAYLGSIGLALVSVTQSEDSTSKHSFTPQMLYEYWRGGISPGDWQDIARRSGQFLRNNQRSSGIASFADLWFKGKGSKPSDFTKILQELIVIKNDFKHDRGPQGYEYENAIQSLREKLDSAFHTIAFFVQYPMRLVQSIDNDWKTKETVISTLVYAGDHPGLRQERLTTSQIISKDKLYLDLSHDFLVPLYPLISVHYCNSCKTRETYMIDRWEGRGGRTVLKSFERGHTHDNNEIAKKVGEDFADWLQDLPFEEES